MIGIGGHLFWSLRIQKCNRQMCNGGQASCCFGILLQRILTRKIWVCLKIVYPIVPSLVLLIIIPFLNSYFIGGYWGYTPFSDIPKSAGRPLRSKIPNPVALEDQGDTPRTKTMRGSHAFLGQITWFDWKTNVLVNLAHVIWAKIINMAIKCHQKYHQLTWGSININTAICPPFLGYHAVRPRRLWWTAPWRSLLVALVALCAASCLAKE